MTPLQSWLLLIAVVATVTVTIIVVWSIIDTILFAIEVRRVRRAALSRDNATRRWQAHQTESEDKTRFHFSRGYPPQRHVEISRNGTGKRVEK